MSQQPHSYDPVQALLERLPDARPTGEGKWTARCPAHDDRKPSLAIARGNNGGALVHCHAGCAPEAIVAALGWTLANLMPSAPAASEPARRTHPTKAKARTLFATARDAVAALERHHGRRSCEWVYQDAGDMPVGLAVRWDTEKGKDIRPVSKTTGGWIIGGMPEPRPLYRLPELLARPGERVYITEGEKAADAAAELGLLATTSSQGAKSAAKTDWRPLAERDAVILPDNDGAGRRYGDDVDATLKGLTPPPTVRVVELPGLSEHGDIADWVDCRRKAGQSDKTIREELERLVAQTPVKADARTDFVSGPVLVRLVDVQPVEVRWLWPGRIALGKLTLIAGDPGLGKSFLTLDMSARVSMGFPWPDSPTERHTPGGVVLLSAEDDLADTIRPRLDAAGADVGRIVALQAVKRFDFASHCEREDPFNLAEDLPDLERAIVEVGECRLVIVDPITAYLGGMDGHKNAEVRGLLAPLAGLAARYGVAVVAVTHLRKGDGPAMYRAMGSLGFVAASRATHAVAKDKDDPTGKRRFFLPVKNNLGNDSTGLAYCLQAARGANGIPRVEWEAGSIDLSAEEALRPDVSDDEADPTELDEAKTWLKNALAAGPVAAKDLLAKAPKDGIATRTLYRAKKDLGAIAFKWGFTAGWAWRLPGVQGGTAEGCQEAQRDGLATFGTVGNLRENPGEKADLPAADRGRAAEDCQGPESGSLGGESLPY